jgi:hypothetical protein
VKVGNLIKFRNHSKSHLGIVLRLETLDEGPHPSQPHREVAYIEWADLYTPPGNYQTYLLEIVSESR